MRFAITLSDRCKPVLDVFVKAGWEPLKVFCTPVDHRMHHHKASVAFAEQHKLPLQLSPMRERDLAELADMGCEALLLGSYNWRVPDWRPYLKYAVNFHPSPLPLARGPYPQVRALLEGRKEWGVTCHKVGPEFDTGDILDQEKFPLGEMDSHQVLDIKLQLALHRLCHRVAGQFERLWAEARPQGEGGSYWPLWSDQDRMLDFRRSTSDLLRQIRAFGDFECVATLNQVTLFVHRAEGWTEAHAFQPGSLIYSQAEQLLVATADGMLLISEWSVHTPGAVTGRGRG
ncbi:methionyl-tRNA formyltransferase [Chromobacterium paludis]|uniref:Formyl transferase n=1 Tax=Chromobacterium paludis TaxID=2605945 RepID=A0A5C1DFL4_9NEIS|nr:formyltransferase family protein [Chromobacterium paludis]QEL55575.1 formyl transferase [Chromobacterium paludis]